MLEKIRTKIESQAAAKGANAKSILDWAISVGRTVNSMKWRHHPVGLRLKLQHRLAERLVFSKIKDGLGGHLRLFICGGAALDPDLATWFEAVGIAVREGWGLSETTAPAAVNGENDFRFATVGKPLDGTEIVIAADGEILVRGPGVFQGYLNDIEATQRAFTPDGFFKTGDLGLIEDGFVKIKGRKKEIIVTAGGKNIAPIPIEQALEGGLIDQAVVIGDNRPYLVALLSLNRDALFERAQTSKWNGDVHDWTARAEVADEIRHQVESAMTPFAPFQTVKKWAILDEPFTEENGLLTPTMKLKREPIRVRYAQSIDTLYAD
jgi:long-chain acyl-CoA synthetase